MDSSFRPNRVLGGPVNQRGALDVSPQSSPERSAGAGGAVRIMGRLARRQPAERRRNHRPGERPSQQRHLCQPGTGGHGPPVADHARLQWRHPGVDFRPADRSFHLASGVRRLHRHPFRAERPWADRHRLCAARASLHPELHALYGGRRPPLDYSAGHAHPHRRGPAAGFDRTGVHWPQSPEHGRDTQQFPVPYAAVRRPWRRQGLAGFGGPGLPARRHLLCQRRIRSDHPLFRRFRPTDRRDRGARRHNPPCGRGCLLRPQ